MRDVRPLSVLLVEDNPGDVRLTREAMKDAKILNEMTVVMDGVKRLQQITIDPEVVSKDDVDMLQDLIVAAVNDAHRKVDEALQQQMSGLMGGMKLPGM